MSQRCVYVVCEARARTVAQTLIFKINKIHTRALWSLVIQRLIVLQNFAPSRENDIIAAEIN